MTGAALAAAASKFAGRPFRLHGRDPETGLDCIGLLSASLRAIGQDVELPTGYRMRTADFPLIPNWADQIGFIAVSDDIVAGDVLFTRPGPGQLHLVIAAPRDGFFVEAHAGLRRIVLRPGPVTEPMVQHWRYQPTP